MFSLPFRSGRYAFSLLELLIVIMIVSLVYFLGFSGVEKEINRPKALTPLNLKSTITHSKLFSGEATLLCINQCKNCYLRENLNMPFEAYDNKIDLLGTKAYTLNAYNELTELEPGRYQDQKIYLEMHFYKNGSSTQLILENQHGIYFLPAFFGEPQKIDSLEEAKRLWLSDSKAVMNRGDFY